VTPTLPAPVVRGLARLRALLVARFGERLREFVLYGSYARGQAHAESDVDVMVVVEGLTESERREVFDLAYDANAAERENWIGLSVLAYSDAEVADLRARERLLLRDIAREGIPA
jgi:predicted nucleotidyltransferase